MTGLYGWGPHGHNAPKGPPDSSVGNLVFPARLLAEVLPINLKFR